LFSRVHFLKSIAVTVRYHLGR